MSQTPIGQGISDYVASVIRTIVPTAVGAIIAWAISLGITLPADAKDLLTPALAFVAGILYYLAVRWLEKRWPKLGVLLGVPKQPVYNALTATEIEADKQAAMSRAVKNPNATK